MLAKSIQGIVEDEMEPPTERLHTDTAVHLHTIMVLGEYMPIKI